MPSPHARLRSATRDDHARLDARFPEGLADAATYRTYVRATDQYWDERAADVKARFDGWESPLGEGWEAPTFGRCRH